MSETFFIKKTAFDDTSNILADREANSFIIGPGELNGPAGIARDSDLRLYGFGAAKWGEGVDQNIFRVLENNACPSKELNDYNPATGLFDYDPLTDPILPKDEKDLGIGNGISTPVEGQTWYNTTNNAPHVLRDISGTKTWESIITETSLNNNAVLKTGDTMTGDLVLAAGSPATGQSATTKDYVDTAVSSGEIPGTVKMFAGDEADIVTGWVLCNGTAISRTTFSALFAIINTKYGIGDGSTTFNVPDMRGRFAVGFVDTATGNDRVVAATPLGKTGGLENVAITIVQLPAHNHAITVNSSSHNHSASTAAAGSHAHAGSTASAVGDHQHPGSWSNAEAGGGDKEIQSWNGNTNWYTGPAGAHSHNLSITNQAAHSHTVTVNSGSHNHTGSSASVGSGQLHENTPPFLTMNYIIKT